MFKGFAVINTAHYRNFFSNRFHRQIYLLPFPAAFVFFPPFQKSSKIFLKLLFSSLCLLSQT